MIQNDDQLQVTRNALLNLDASMAALHRKKADIHPDRYALMVEPILDHIRRLRAEIDDYIGLSAAAKEVVPAPPASRSDPSLRH
jgi:hypothetical protein